MLMPKRSYSGAGSYRYGFNGKENDNDIKGLGNQQDYGMRIYDARVGRFLSVDPLQKKFAWLGPFNYADNNPIKFIDLDGKEPLDFSWNWKRSTEHPTKWNYSVVNVYDEWTEKVWTCMQYPNDHHIYYWKPYDGSNQTFDYKASKNSDGTWNGKWVEFETQETLQAQLGAKVADGMAGFFAVGIVAAVASPAIATGTGLLVAASEAAVLNIGTRIYPYLPIAGYFGNQAAKMLDESGAVQAESSLSLNLLERARDRLLRTSVNSKLSNLVDKLYRATSKIESGSTGDAIRHEMQGGVLPNSKDHLQKAKEGLNTIRDLLKENFGKLDGGDRKNVFEIIHDLTNGTGLEWKGLNYDYIKNKVTK